MLPTRIYWISILSISLSLNTTIATLSAPRHSPAQPSRAQTSQTPPDSSLAEDEPLCYITLSGRTQNLQNLCGKSVDNRDRQSTSRSFPGTYPRWAEGPPGALPKHSRSQNADALLEPPEEQVAANER